MIAASCPECQQKINLGTDPEIGQPVICRSCNTKLEVVWLFPVFLDYMDIQEQVAANQALSLE
jgi:lysine biosynthesis protein LysW